MIFEVGCRIRYEAWEPTTFVFAVQVIDGAAQTLLEEDIRLPTGLAADFLLDAGGNRFIRLAAPTGAMELAYRARLRGEARVPPDAPNGQTSIHSLPPSVLPYLTPSRYCPSDQLGAEAEALFGRFADDVDKARALEAWLHETLTYETAASDGSTTALDTLRARAGVCRDFAHLGVAMARALSLPARFVSCYAPGLRPPDFHAVFEVYCGQAWRMFDATRRARLADIAPIAIGRDAADTPFAIAFGPADLVECVVFADRAP